MESGGQSQQLLICLLLLREGARPWRNPVYLSLRCELLSLEKKTLDYNGARFYVKPCFSVKAYLGEGHCSLVSRFDFLFCMDHQTRGKVTVRTDEECLHACLKRR